MNNPVKGEGSKSSLIAVIGEAPGEREVWEERPFVGPSGAWLDIWLASAGIPRPIVRLLNCCTDRPEANRFEHFWLDKKCIKPTEYLVQQINQLVLQLSQMPNLRAIIALGRNPMYCLTGKDGISKWRGSVLDYAPPPWVDNSFPLTTPIIPTLHPAFVLRQWTAAPLVRHDLKVAAHVAKHGWSAPVRELIWNPSFSQVVEYLRDLRNRPRPTAVDIECIPDTRLIYRISLSDRSNYSMSIPFQILSRGARYFSIDEEVLVWQELALLLNEPSVPKVFQNGIFDVTWLEYYGLRVRNYAQDTMIAQHNIQVGLPTKMKPLGLAMITSLYTSERYYKDDGKAASKTEVRRADDDKLGRYSAMDSAVTIESLQEQVKTKAFNRNLKTYQFEMDLMRGPILSMMRRGIRFDVGAQSEGRLRSEAEMALLSARLNNIIGYEINLDSPKQLATLLFTEMKIPTVKRKTDIEELLIARAKSPNQVLNIIIQHRKISKTHGDWWEASTDKGRIRCSYSPTTTTGRFRSGSSPLNNGRNLQNIPRAKNIRNLLIADPGYIMFEADLEQAELRAVAYYARAFKLINLLEDSLTDVHSIMASDIFGRLITKENRKERDLGKKIVHASDYLAGARALVHACRVEMDYDLKESTAKQLIAKYLAKYPEIPNYHWHTEHQLKASSTLTNCFGRERIFLEREGHERLREGVAFLPQSTIADLLNRIMLRMFWRYPEILLLMQVHDSIVGEVPENMKEETEAKIIECANYPVTINGMTMRVPVAIKWGYKYGDLR